VEDDRVPPVARIPEHLRVATLELRDVAGVEAV
jgi:hypothetical protein